MDVPTYRTSRPLCTGRSMSKMSRESRPDRHCLCGRGKYCGQWSGEEESGTKSTLGQKGSYCTPRALLAIEGLEGHSAQAMKRIPETCVEVCDTFGTLHTTRRPMTQPT